MQAPSESPTVRVLRWLARAVCRHPRWFVWPQLLLCVGSVAYTVQALRFDTSRNDLVGADKQYHRNFLRFKHEFLAQDDLVAVVESEDAGKNRHFVERLGARLVAETNLFTDVIFNNDVKMLGNKALLFFPLGDLQTLRDTLGDYRPFIQNFSQATNLHSLFRLVNQQFRSARREESGETGSLVKALPALERILREAEEALLRAGTPPSPGVTALFNAGAEAESRIYITYDNGRIYLVSARALTEDLENAAVRRLRELVRQTESEVPGVNAAITGEAVLEFDEMRQSQRDTTLATVVSLVLVALIFIYGYNESGRPLKATACLVVGLGYTLGYATLVIGHLNILTITFVPMLIGLSIDFGVHLITRYEEELRHGRSEPEAMEKAIVNTGLGIFTGAFTTAGAFLAMGLTDFKGIREMGIISGGGLLICLVPMMTLLPVWLLRPGRQNVIDHYGPHKPETRARIERLWLDRPYTVLALSAILCVVSILKARHVPFDYNLLNLQTRGLPAVVFEHKLIDAAEKSVLFGAVVADSLEAARAVEARITNLPAVASVDSMTRFLTEDQSAKLALVGEVKQELASLDFAPPDPRPVNVPQLDLSLAALQGMLKQALPVVEKEGDTNLLQQMRSLGDAAFSLQQRMNADPLRASSRLAEFQQALFNDIRATFHGLRSQDDRERMRAEDLPSPLRHRFISKDGSRHLLQVYPKSNVWERVHQAEFVQQLRTVDPNVTGTPVQLLEYTTLLKESYQEAALYALGAIAILVFIHFRSLVCVVLALLPVAFGTLWMVGFMGWGDIPFNPANVMTLPLVVGIGVTSGIHILNRFAEEKNPGILAKSTGKAVLVSGLTTIAGFGSLCLARHQGIASLGYVMAVGTATCMLAALTFLPAMLHLLERAGWSLERKAGRNKTQ